MIWYANKDDVIGMGWFVSNLEAPRSGHDMRPDGDPTKRGFVICQFASFENAKAIADALTQRAYVPPEIINAEDAFDIEGWWGLARVQVDEGQTV